MNSFELPTRMDEINFAIDGNKIIIVGEILSEAAVKHAQLTIILTTRTDSKLYSKKVVVNCLHCIICIILINNLILQQISRLICM